MEKHISEMQKWAEIAKAFLKNAFSPENRKFTIFMLTVFFITMLLLFPPDIHHRIRRIRSIQPPRSYSPPSGAYEKATRLDFSLQIDDPPAAERERIERELVKLLPLDFEINQYFKILDRLSMEEGYVLDYRYHLSSPHGNPIMYARQKTEKRDISIGGSMPKYIKSGADAYLAHIKTDGSRESFIQLAVLHLIGGNFYFYWHAFYDDISIYSRIPAQVSYSSDKVSVSLFVQTHAAYMAIYTLTFKRDFPHLYVSEDNTRIIPKFGTVRY